MEASADIIEIAKRVETPKPGQFVVAGVPVASGDARDEVPRELVNALYQRCYCRPTKPRAGMPASTAIEARTLLARYSLLNRGHGTMDAGWRVVRLDPVDGRCVVEKRGITLWVDESSYSSVENPVTPGMLVRIHVPKESQRLLPGFYAFIGNCQTDDEIVDASRLYWHLTTDGAPLFVDSISSLFNDASIPFHAKILSDPSAFFRADAAVLYLPRRYLIKAWPILHAVYAQLRPHLRTETPMFTSKLAPGLAVADDIGDTFSFGLHRCGLVGAGLIAASGVRASSHSERVAAIVKALVDAGVNPLEPHLRSTDSRPYPPFDHRNS
jgi:hypothetical protein